MDKNAKIYYFPHKPSGCYWYRIQQPMEMLKANGITTQLVPINSIADDDFTALQLYGATPFSVERVLKYMKEEGKKIVYDADDALDLIEPTNPNYYAVKKDAKSADEVLAYADEVTVSCPAMKEYMQGKFKEPITVIPNCYTPSEWTFPRPKREGIRIGFAGSSTHVKDLVEIIPVIKRLKEKYPEIIFFIMGFGQSDYQTWYKQFRYISPAGALKDLQELDKNLSELGDFQWVPFVDYDKFPSTLINMSLDIGICPLKETPFDKCRTACKAMEYTLSGALALASDTTPYREDKSSILVKDNEWESILEFYIQNPQIREQARLSHLDWIQKNRVNTTQLEPLKRVYGVSPCI
jgi:glycosyltransferase involved in cell wall biosynthesis